MGLAFIFICFFVLPLMVIWSVKIRFAAKLYLTVDLFLLIACLLTQIGWALRYDMSRHRFIYSHRRILESLQSGQYDDQTLIEALKQYRDTNEMFGHDLPEIEKPPGG